jgi:DedD protein
MDRALKERIIGAAVLVVFVVLVVPVFLDGPPEEGVMVSERVPLPGQDEQSDSRTVVLERDRKEPVPATAEQTTPDRSQQAVRQPQAIAAAETRTETEKPAPDPIPRTEPADSSPTGMWAVQLGSFGNQENAERLAADLRKQGFAAFLSQLSTDAGQLHRVRIGPQKDRDSAEAMAARLQKAGHKGQVVPHP